MSWYALSKSRSLADWSCTVPRPLRGDRMLRGRCAAYVTAVVAVVAFINGPSQRALAANPIEIAQNSTPADDLVSSRTLGELPIIEASVDRNEVDVADPFSLKVVVQAADGVQVQFPQYEELGPFMISGTEDLFDVPSENGRRWTRIYLLESFEGGELNVPSLEVGVGSRTLSTDAIAVRVRSLIEPQANPLQFRDLKDLEEIPEDTFSRRTITLCGVAAVALAAIAYYVLARRRKRFAAPDFWAYEQLDALQARPECERGDRASILPPLADILREYIRRRFEIAAPQQTTPEFLASVQTDRRLGEARRDEVKALLREVDEIKFAQLIPADSNMHGAFELVRSFVQNTSRDGATD